ncbi:unnamed protein product [Linum tenue]|uniref:Cytochrome P450 n=1 Tax=Linum tenue TaxID=586396 RepID=A0AAV0NH73_9ROSI|nr:unnamed protein product [Linum tenue]
MEQMMMSTCINIIVAAASFLILWQIYRSRRNRTWAAPHGCTNWPVVGMLPSLICHASDFHDRYLTATLRRHGGTVELKGPWFSGMDSIVTSDPANVRHIQSGNFGNYPKGPVMKEVFEPFGDGIFTVDFESWVLQRKKLHLLIKNNRYKLLMEKATHAKLEYGMFQILDHLAENGDESDLQDIFQRFTFDAICIIVMGLDPRSLNIDFHDAPLAKAFDDIGKGIFRRHVIPKIAWKLQKWLRMGTEKQLSIAMQRFDDFLYSFISSRRKQIIAKRMDDEVEETVDDDLLTAHIKGEIMDKNDGVLVLTEDKFLRDMVLNLLGAGRSTIASTLVWLFWSLTNNPHVESKILAELNSNPPTLEKIHGDENVLINHPYLINLWKLIIIFLMIIMIYRP